MKRAAWLLPLLLQHTAGYVFARPLCSSRSGITNSKPLSCAFTCARHRLHMSSTVPPPAAIENAIHHFSEPLTVRPALMALLRHLRTAALLFLPSKFEFEVTLRLIMAACVGMCIGMERRFSHRPAGVRTMALVSVHTKSNTYN
jgi:MgtC family